MLYKDVLEKDQSFPKHEIHGPESALRSSLAYLKLMQYEVYQSSRQVHSLYMARNPRPIMLAKRQTRPRKLFNKLWLYVLSA